MSIEIRLGGYDTINFQNVGDRYIAEYLFGEYYDGERNLVSLIGRTDVEQTNIEGFYTALDEKFLAIIKMKISELISSNMYVKKKNLQLPKAGKKEIIDLEKVNVSIDELDNSQLISELSGLSNLSPEIIGVSGKSKISEVDMEEFEELYDREENNLERKLFKGIADNIEIIDTNTSIVIRCNLINVKMALLKEAGITMLRLGGSKNETRKSQIVIYDIYDENNKMGNHYFMEGLDKVDGMKSFFDTQNIPRNRGKGLAEKMGTDEDIKLFFINRYRDSLGDILNAQNLTLEILKQPKSFDDDTAIITTVLQIEQKQLHLTDKPLLEGDKGEDSISTLYGKKSRKEGIRTINYPLPPHLTFGNPKEDSEGNTLYYSNDGKLKQEAQEFFISLNRRKNRLRRAIDSLGDDI